MILGFKNILKAIFIALIFFSVIISVAQEDNNRIIKPVEINYNPQAPPPPMPPEDRDPENPDKIQLAAKYFNNGEFEKAGILYKELYSTKGNYIYYKNYLHCLEETGKYDEAENLIKKQIKKRTQNHIYQIDLGYIYDKQGKNKKAIRTFDDIIKDLPHRQDQIISIANTFMSRTYTDYALQVYEKGRSLMDYTFHMEIANVHYLSGNNRSMIETYLDFIEIQPEKFTKVKNRLQYYINRDKEKSISQILKNQLLIRIQNKPGQILFSRLLLWLSIQQKDFEIALQQAKAIDKREKEEGETLMELGEICYANKSFDFAIECFNDILKKGKNNYLYVDALIGLLGSRYQKITSTPNYIERDIIKLEDDYFNTLNDFGKNSGTVPIMKDLAHLQTFYLDKPQDAISLLEEAIEIPRTNKTDIALCKIELADILLLTGEVWEASLLYSQVEKSLKHDAIGDIAKYKNAKLSFYIGEFDWAKNQLYALKGSTSSLISNDAIQLSVLIGDNIGADSSTTALALYAKADLLLFKNKYDEAFIVMDSILILNTYHAIFDDVLLLRAKTNIRLKEYDIAANDLLTILADYPWDITADNALFLLADINQFQYLDEKKAQELYLQLMTDYTGSLFVTEARKRYRNLRGDDHNNQE